MRKYKDVLLGKEAVLAQTKELDVTKNEGKIAMRARDANESAFADLTLACQDNASFGIMTKSVKEELPEEDASLAWESLKERYYQQDLSSALVSLKTQYNKCKLTSVKKTQRIGSPS